jgi:hypothetical protein
MKQPPKSRNGIVLHLAGFAFLCGLFGEVARPQQSSTPPVSSPQNLPRSAAPDADQRAAQAAAKNASSKTVVPGKPKKVLTNDDLEGHANDDVPPSSQIVPGDSSSLLNCESVCEEKARASLGYDSDREGEWRMQVAGARRELVADTEWRNLLAQTIQQTRTYCNFLEQQSRKIAPANNSYDAQVQRARQQQYFENMDRGLQQNLESTANRSQTRIQEVQALSPVRAAMMTVQLSRIAERNCDLPR